jgi:mRNA interferase RelE/StbE
MLELKFSSQARKFLKKLDDTNWKRIMDKIEELRIEPFPKKVKRVEGRKEKTFRMRVGDYRILYIVLKERNILFISKIDKRDGVYD